MLANLPNADSRVGDQNQQDDERLDEGGDGACLIIVFFEQSKNLQVDQLFERVNIL